jgi:hypothetical protein
MANTIYNYFIPFYFEESPPIPHPKPVFRPMIREFPDVALQPAFKCQESIVHTTSLILWHSFQVLLSLRLQLDSIAHSNPSPDRCGGAQPPSSLRLLRPQPFSFWAPGSPILMVADELVAVKQKKVCQRRLPI